MKKTRKDGLNSNKLGSVRNVNGKVYVDFMYLDERVRESSGLSWNMKNAKEVRKQLDRIILEIDSGFFRFAEIFPDSKKKDYFSLKERQIFGESQNPEDVFFKDYVWEWYKLLKSSGRVTGRTLNGYKGYIENYLEPYFGKLTFANLNKNQFEKFIAWAREQKLRKKVISNKTVNKLFVPLRMICNDAAIEYEWGNTFNPFFGFKRLPEDDPYEKLFPFSIQEQEKILSALPDHWKPFFDVAFKIGLRQGEQFALKPEDVDLDNRLLKIRRAFTKDENGKSTIGKTKNKYSRRIIKLIPVMFNALKSQQVVYEKFRGKYFFCNANGCIIDTSHLRKKVWIPALKKAGIEYREMKQTRHSFATNALSCGESPLWIAKIMGHRDTDMIIRVYSKFIEDARGFQDGSSFDAFYKNKGKNQ